MSEALRVGVIGDQDSGRLSHEAADRALGHAARALSAPLDLSWLPTRSLSGGAGDEVLRSFDALWCAPGSPYKSVDGALWAIRFARERGVPLLAT
jgi:CTP synthase (UTP-ammonia lyase)